MIVQKLSILVSENENWFQGFEDSKMYSNLWLKVSGDQKTSHDTIYIYTYIYIYIYIYMEHTISFQTFFVWALLLIVHTWNSSPLQSNLLQLQSTCCTIPTTSGRPHGSPLVWVCQWPSSQPLSFPQLSHNDSL